MTRLTRPDATRRSRVTDSDHGCHPGETSPGYTCHVGHTPGRPKEDTVFGSTPAERTTPRNPVTLSGTWFGRMGTRPYELLGLTQAVPATATLSVRATLPARSLAA